MCVCVLMIIDFWFGPFHKSYLLFFPLSLSLGLEEKMKKKKKKLYRGNITDHRKINRCQKPIAHMSSLESILLKWRNYGTNCSSLRWFPLFEMNEFKHWTLSCESMNFHVCSKFMTDWFIVIWFVCVQDAPNKNHTLKKVLIDE